MAWPLREELIFCGFPLLILIYSISYVCTDFVKPRQSSLQCTSYRRRNNKQTKNIHIRKKSLSVKYFVKIILFTYMGEKKKKYVLKYRIF